jgi:hypothetical protein
MDYNIEDGVSGKVGIVLRYKNDKDYSVVEISKTGFIVKVRMGNTTKDLCKALLPHVKGYWYSIRIVVKGDEL